MTMPTKTINLELDAYEKLRSAKRFPRESFSDVVRRVHIPNTGILGRDLLSREVIFEEEDFASIDELNANDAAPDIP